jgi:hypothetical protein
MKGYEEGSCRTNQGSQGKRKRKGKKAKQVVKTLNVVEQVVE